MALVNCLNFGNPEHPEVMWQFAEVVDGMSEACRALGLPVIGGNVSFYNESDGADIHPTPVVGVVGLIDRLDSRIPPAALTAGSQHRRPGRHRWPSSAAPSGPPAATACWAGCRRRPTWPPAPASMRLVADLVGERVRRRRPRLLRRRAGRRPDRDGHRRGACGFRWRRKARLAGLIPSAACFSESANRVVLSVDEARVDEILGRAAAAGVPAAVIGTAGGDRLVWTGAFDVALADAETAWRDALPVALAAESPSPDRPLTDVVANAERLGPGRRSSCGRR